jgi:hypothetical protein
MLPAPVRAIVAALAGERLEQLAGHRPTPHPGLNAARPLRTPFGRDASKALSQPHCQDPRKEPSAMGVRESPDIVIVIV